MTIELYDSEILASAEVLNRLQQKYFYQTLSPAVLTSLTNEAEDEFRKIGLVVQVDCRASLFAATPQPPTIEIVGRVESLDRERQRQEVQNGVADEYYEKKRRKK